MSQLTCFKASFRVSFRHQCLCLGPQKMPGTLLISQNLVFQLSRAGGSASADLVSQAWISPNLREFPKIIMDLLVRFLFAPVHSWGPLGGIWALWPGSPRLCPTLPDSAQLCPTLPDSARLCSTLPGRGADLLDSPPLRGRLRPPTLPDSARLCPTLPDSARLSSTSLASPPAPAPPR